MRKLRFFLTTAPVGAPGLLLGLWWLVASSPASAGEINVMPSTRHSALTLITDDTFGFQVLPGKPLKLKLVGPGTLTLTVRLNHNTKIPLLKAQLDILEGKKRVGRENLKLSRSRVGAYKEDSSIYLSLPKILKLSAPEGVSIYTLSLRAAGGITMTVRLSYVTDADQSAAQRGDQALSMAPPTPSSGSGAEEIPLAPLVMDFSSEKQPPVEEVAEKTPAEQKPKKKPEAKKPAKKPVSTGAQRKLVAEAPAVEKPVEAPAVEPKKPTEEESGLELVGLEAKTEEEGERPEGLEAATEESEEQEAVESPPDPALATEEVGRVSTLEIKPEDEPPILEKPARGPSLPVVSVGLKAGQISPLQKVGGTTFTGSLDLRYILPVFDGRLTVGVEGGYYRYQLAITGKDREVTLTVIPIALQIFYRLPLSTFLEPFFGAGGDIYICSGKDQRTDMPVEINSGSAVVFGGHLVGGVESKLGPGFVLLEIRAGISVGDAAVWKNANISGLSTVLGYRFLF